MNDNLYILVILSITGLGLLVTGFILIGVRNQNKLLLKQKELAAAAIAHQKDLLRAVITSQETERHRIGKDLHDEVGTALSALRMIIEKNDERDREQSKKIIDNVIGRVRQISHNLSPRVIGSMGFYDALHELSDMVNASGSLIVSLDFTEEDIPTGLQVQIAIAIYRVLAELVNNSIKHAQASVINIRIYRLDNSMHINYLDDGIGMLYNNGVIKNGMGLRNIESRLNMIGAEWHINEENVKGYNMKLLIPIT